MDEEGQLKNLPPRRSAREFEAAVDRSAKARKKSHNQDFNYETVTTIDWNNGASPLDAWLNQSAVPWTISPSYELQPNPNSVPDDLLAGELDEIEVFRNVHIPPPPEPKRPDTNLPAPNVDDLDFEAQINYRDIIELHPSLAVYLAHRLAVANHNRAERLRLQRNILAEFQIFALHDSEEPAKAPDEMEKSQRCRSSGERFHRKCLHDISTSGRPRFPPPRFTASWPASPDQQDTVPA